MLVTEPEEDLSFATGIPPREFVPISYCLFKDISGTSKNVKVLETFRREPCPREDVAGTQTGGCVGHVVVQEAGVLDSHGPQGDIGDVGPMDGGMNQHGASTRHDCLDCALGNAVVVMGPSARKSADLVKGGEVALEITGSEAGAVVE